MASSDSIQITLPPDTQNLIFLSKEGFTAIENKTLKQINFISRLVIPHKIELIGHLSLDELTSTLKYFSNTSDKLIHVTKYKPKIKYPLVLRLTLPMESILLTFRKGSQPPVLSSIMDSSPLSDMKFILQQGHIVTSIYIPRGNYIKESPNDVCIKNNMSSTELIECLNHSNHVKGRILTFVRDEVIWKKGYGMVNDTGELIKDMASFSFLMILCVPCFYLCESFFDL